MARHTIRLPSAHAFRFIHKSAIIAPQEQKHSNKFCNGIYAQMDMECVPLFKASTEKHETTSTLEEGMRVENSLGVHIAPLVLFFSLFDKFGCV